MTRTHRCNESHEINGMYTENVNTDSEVKLHWDLCHLWYFELTKVKAATGVARISCEEGHETGRKNL